MTTIIPAFASTVSSAGSLLQPKADGEGVNFAELLESAETGAGQQAQAGNESADKQEVAGSEQGETTPKEADIKVKAEPEEEADKPAGATAEQKHDKPEEELRADTLQSGNLVPAAAIPVAVQQQASASLQSKSEPDAQASSTRSENTNIQNVKGEAPAASAESDNQPAAKSESAVKDAPVKAAVVNQADTKPARDSVPAADNMQIKNDDIKLSDAKEAAIEVHKPNSQAAAIQTDAAEQAKAEPKAQTQLKTQPIATAVPQGSAPAGEPAEPEAQTAQRLPASQASTAQSQPAQQPASQVQAVPPQAGQQQPAVTQSQSVSAAEPELNAPPQHEQKPDSANQTAPRQETTQAPKEPAATPNWLAQIEHGRRWSQQGSTESKADTTVAEQNTESLSSPITEKASADAGTDGESRDEDASRGEKLADALAGAVQSGAHQAEKNEIQPLQQTAAITATREAAAPERAAQPQLERALNLHQAAPEQNARQLSQQVQVMVNQELQEADIRLNPSELGGIRIQLKFEQGEVSMQIQAQHAQARDMLEQAMPRLRDMLQQQGIQLGQGQVGSFAGQQQNTAQNGNQGQGATGRENGHNSSSFEQGPNDDEAGFTQYSAGRTLHEGGIDFFA
ncbi:flagellar hook-length control protein FliK [Oceanimonas smirnovii]|uniref:flagellar hook-length control protein FliK n=1 Tax=Oceanimonas smirnovii TaxID=264574 RepID=UPI003FD2B82D